MATNKPDFCKAQVSVTMSGEQWFALMARIASQGLSLEGARRYAEATVLLTQQIKEASDRLLAEAAAQDAEDTFSVEAEAERNFPFSGSF